MIIITVIVQIFKKSEWFDILVLALQWCAGMLAIKRM